MFLFFQTDSFPGYNFKRNDFPRQHDFPKPLILSKHSTSLLSKKFAVPWRRACQILISEPFT